MPKFIKPAPLAGPPHPLCHQVPVGDILHEIDHVLLPCTFRRDRVAARRSGTAAPFFFGAQFQIPGGEWRVQSGAAVATCAMATPAPTVPDAKCGKFNVFRKKNQTFYLEAAAAACRCSASSYILSSLLFLRYLERHCV